MQNLQAATESAGSTRFVYDGRLGELYVIFIKNVLLSIITLGIYRFWGKTRVRRYLWSHTSLFGDRFEYTGTGGELFRGFLLALGLFVVMIIVFGILTWLLGPLGQILPLFLYFLFFYLFFVARFTALRYRLSRTRWRGIRGGLSGSPWRFAWMSIGWNLLNLLAVGFLSPVVAVRTLGYRVRNAFFGTARTQFKAQAGDLYPKYLIYYFGSVAIAIVGLAVVAGVLYGTDLFYDLLFTIEMSGEPGGPPPDMIGTFVLVLYGVLFFIGLLTLPLVCWYYSFFYNYLVGGTRLAGLQFSAHVTTGGMFQYLIVNVLIMVLTLGIGFPWVLHRVMEFITANVLVDGNLDAETIRQSQLAQPKTGEGMFELLDAGVV